MERFETEEQQVEAIKRFWKEHGTAIIVGAALGLGGLWGTLGDFLCCAGELATILGLHQDEYFSEVLLLLRLASLGGETDGVLAQVVELAGLLRDAGDIDREHARDAVS